MAASDRLTPSRPAGDARRPKERAVNGNVRLGRVGGVEVRINWSWLVIFALIVWSLADGVFPSQNPGLSRRLTLPHIPGALLATKSLQISGIGDRQPAITAHRNGEGKIALVPAEGECWEHLLRGRERHRRYGAPHRWPSTSA